MRQVFKEKARANVKCEFLRSCLARNSFPKGTTPTVPLKILDAPDDLKQKWTTILQDCAKQLTLALVNYHHSQIVHHEQHAASVISNASHIIIPEHITNVPEIPEMIETTIQDLICESSLLSRNLRKGSSNNKPPNPKRTKTPPTTTPKSPSHPPNPPPSKNGKSPKNGKSSKNYPWRPLKLKKQKK